MPVQAIVEDTPGVYHQVMHVQKHQDNGVDRSRRLAERVGVLRTIFVDLEAYQSGRKGGILEYLSELPKKSLNQIYQKPSACLGVLR